MEPGILEHKPLDEDGIRKGFTTHESIVVSLDETLLVPDIKDLVFLDTQR
jgi:hypothetical protein